MIYLFFIKKIIVSLLYIRKRYRKKVWRYKKKKSMVQIGPY